ncbi:Hypothetical Protein FCC1311_017512 [Hondaea fermentalgiana]|uniref:HECT domain-containing protein n=1 Tax=Hondaea fermentalgiana TaxID=2315210 RepID=A0A2R5G3E2_9STRA|nr:Hypothetical Protein FCC1311_017512 [Hondaea fermentalgiana]|eukprot:GBG25532.1 Hypothetical Protein FCC1311_017512 [Hondaea fermentalgiana]
MLSRVNMVALCKSVAAMCANPKVPAIVQAGFEVMKDTESKAMAEIQKIIEDAPNVVAGKAEEFRAVLTQNFDAVADKVAVFVEACNSADHATIGIAGAALITTVILLGMSRRRGRKRASSNIAGLVEDVKDVTMETEVQEIEIPAENSAAGQAKEEGQANGENAADNTEDKMMDDDKAEAQDKAQDKDDKAEVKPENKVADQAKAQDKDDKAEVKPENKVADQAKAQDKDDKAEVKPENKVADQAKAQDKDDKAEVKPENKVADQAKDEAKDAEKTLDSAANQAEDDKAEDDKAADDKAEDDKAEDDKAEDDKAEDDKAEDDKAEDDKAEDDKAEDKAKALAKDDKAEDSAADQAKDEYKDEGKTVEEDKEMKEYAIMGHHTGELDDSQSTGADVPNEMASISPADKKKKKSETTWKSHGTDRELPVQQAVQPSRSTKTNTSRRDVPACRPSKSTKHGRTGSKPKRAKYESLSERKSQPFTTRSSQRTSDRYGSNKEIPHDYVKRSRETESKTPEDILEDTQTQRRCASKNETDVPLDGFTPSFNLTLNDQLDRHALCKAHACFKQVVLPDYAIEAVLRDKVLFAIRNTDGFLLG